MRRTVALAAAALAVAFFSETAARGDEPIVVWPRDDVPAPLRDGRADHAAYDALPRKYVDAMGLLGYARWKAKDAPALERYLQSVAAMKPQALADDPERLAYTINVCSALTIHGMLRFYRTRSIRDHVALVRGFRFWDDVRIEVDGGGADRGVHGEGAPLRGRPVP